MFSFSRAQGSQRVSKSPPGHLCGQAHARIVVEMSWLAYGGQVDRWIRTTQTGAPHMDPGDDGAARGVMIEEALQQVRIRLLSWLRRRGAAGQPAVGSRAASDREATEAAEDVRAVMRRWEQSQKEATPVDRAKGSDRTRGEWPGPRWHSRVGSSPTAGDRDPGLGTLKLPGRGAPGRPGRARGRTGMLTRRRPWPISGTPVPPSHGRSAGGLDLNREAKDQGQRRAILMEDRTFRRGFAVSRAMYGLLSESGHDSTRVQGVGW